jgi:hypothetical protein
MRGVIPVHEHQLPNEVVEGRAQIVQELPDPHTQRGSGCSRTSRILQTIHSPSRTTSDSVDTKSSLTVLAACLAFDCGGAEEERAADSSPAGATEVTYAAERVEAEVAGG